MPKINLNYLVFTITFVYLILFCSGDALAADFLNGFEQSTPDLYIGENDGLYLRPRGFYINLLNNDFLCYNPSVTPNCGNDKLMSNSIGTGFQAGVLCLKIFLLIFTYEHKK
ncbi:hypothetical protein [Silvanigrella aquatica]|uniref:Uncharacterized protein n=1 Tax=Silvanigrella aquatica TaxID=1915309 RepID=A0A1L4CYW3_9BACT|nr:hypothetical protein [Silvanigrella aquatica]APJ03141.1 hypothetical protein AXG55_04160 [Silvanigrella aquatica]